MRQCQLCGTVPDPLAAALLLPPLRARRGRRSRPRWSWLMQTSAGCKSSYEGVKDDEACRCDRRRVTGAIGGKLPVQSKTVDRCDRRKLPAGPNTRRQRPVDGSSDAYVRQLDGDTN